MEFVYEINLNNIIREKAEVNININPIINVYRLIYWHYLYKLTNSKKRIDNLFKHIEKDKKQSDISASDAPLYLLLGQKSKYIIRELALKNKESETVISKITRIYTNSVSLSLYNYILSNKKYKEFDEFITLINLQLFNVKFSACPSDLLSYKKIIHNVNKNRLLRILLKLKRLAAK